MDGFNQGSCLLKEGNRSEDVCSSLTLLRSQEREWELSAEGAKRTQVQVQRFHLSETQSSAPLRSSPPARPLRCPPASEEGRGPEREGLQQWPSLQPLPPSAEPSSRRSPPLSSRGQEGLGTEQRAEERGKRRSLRTHQGAGVEMEDHCHSKNQTSSGVTPTREEHGPVTSLLEP